MVWLLFFEESAPWFDLAYFTLKRFVYIKTLTQSTCLTNACFSTFRFTFLKGFIKARPKDNWMETFCAKGPGFQEYWPLPACYQENHSCLIKESTQLATIPLKQGKKKKQERKKRNKPPIPKHRKTDRTLYFDSQCPPSIALSIMQVPLFSLFFT